MIRKSLIICCIAAIIAIPILALSSENSQVISIADLWGSAVRKSIGADSSPQDRGKQGRARQSTLSSAAMTGSTKISQKIAAATESSARSEVVNVTTNAASPTGATTASVWRPKAKGGNLTVLSRKPKKVSYPSNWDFENDAVMVDGVDSVLDWKEDNFPVWEERGIVPEGTTDAFYQELQQEAEAKKEAEQADAKDEEDGEQDGDDEEKEQDVEEVALGPYSYSVVELNIGLSKWGLYDGLTEPNKATGDQRIERPTRYAVYNTIIGPADFQGAGHPNWVPPAVDEAMMANVNDFRPVGLVSLGHYGSLVLQVQASDPKGDAYIKDKAGPDIQVCENPFPIEGSPGSYFIDRAELSVAAKQQGPYYSFECAPNPSSVAIPDTGERRTIYAGCIGNMPPHTCDNFDLADLKNLPVDFRARFIRIVDPGTNDPDAENNREGVDIDSVALPNAVMEIQREKTSSD